MKDASDSPAKCRRRIALLQAQRTLCPAVMPSGQQIAQMRHICPRRTEEKRMEKAGENLKDSAGFPSKNSELYEIAKRRAEWVGE